MKMVDLQQIHSFFVILMAILGFISLLGGVINIFIKWVEKSRSKKNEERINSLEKLLQNDIEPRIVSLERRTSEQENFIQILCSSLLAMISHEINGNSKDKLEKAKAELEKFLISK